MGQTVFPSYTSPAWASGCASCASMSCRSSGTCSWVTSRSSAHIPYYSARYLVAPGLSGWAQLKHDRDPHHGADIEETGMKLTYDLYYLRHRSLPLDLYILLQTFRIVFTARGS